MPTSTQRSADGMISAAALDGKAKVAAGGAGGSVHNPPSDVAAATVAAGAAADGSPSKKKKGGPLLEVHTPHNDANAAATAAALAAAITKSCGDVHSSASAEVDARPAPEDSASRTSCPPPPLPLPLPLPPLAATVTAPAPDGGAASSLNASPISWCSAIENAQARATLVHSGGICKKGEAAISSSVEAGGTADNFCSLDNNNVALKAKVDDEEGGDILDDIHMQHYCLGCGIPKDSKDFSPNQWKKPDGKCLECLPSSTNPQQDGQRIVKPEDGGHVNETTKFPCFQPNYPPQQYAMNNDGKGAIAVVSSTAPTAKASPYEASSSSDLTQDQQIQHPSPTAAVASSHQDFRRLKMPEEVLVVHKKKRSKKIPKLGMETAFTAEATMDLQNASMSTPSNIRSSTAHSLHHSASGFPGSVHTPERGLQHQQQLQHNSWQPVVHNHLQPVFTPRGGAPVVPQGSFPTQQAILQQPITHQPVPYPPLPVQYQQQPLMATMAPGSEAFTNLSASPGYVPVPQAHAMPIHYPQQQHPIQQMQYMQPVQPMTTMTAQWGMAPGFMVPPGFDPIQQAQQEHLLQQQYQQQQQSMAVAPSNAIPLGFVPIEQQQNASAAVGGGGVPPDWGLAQPAGSAAMVQQLQPAQFANPNSYHQVMMPAAIPTPQYHQPFHQQYHTAYLQHQQEHQFYSQQRADNAPTPSPAPLPMPLPEQAPWSLSQHLQSQSSPARMASKEPMLMHKTTYQPYQGHEPNASPDEALSLSLQNLPPSQLETPPVIKLSPLTPTFGRQYEYQQKNDGTYLVRYVDAGVKSSWMPMKTLPTSYLGPQ